MVRKTGSNRYSGAEGRKRAEEVAKEQDTNRELARARAGMPFRFRMPPGETREIAVLDEEPSFYRWEHCTKDNNGKYTVYTGCIKETDNCPRCDDDERQSYYAMFLTVLDFTEFKGKDGKMQEFSRKLLCVKSAQQKKFFRLLDRHGTLRGMVLQMTRDGDRDASIGNDIEFMEFMDEDEINSGDFIREWTDREGKHHTEDCTEVYDYEELYPEETYEELAKYCKNPPREVVGSRRSNRKALDEEEEDEDEDEKPTRGRRRGRKAEEKPTRGKAPNRRGRKAPEPKEEEEEEFEEEDDQGTPWDDEEDEPKVEAEEKPKRGRRRGRKVEDTDDANVVSEEKAPARRRRRGRA